MSGPVISRHPIVGKGGIVTPPWLYFFQQLAIGGFSTIVITGDGTITATQAGQTLTLTPGDGITITSDPATDTITISADGSAFGNDMLLMGG